jgi:hypothetical protein
MFFVPGLIFSIVIKDITHHPILLPLLPVSPSSHLAFTYFLDHSLAGSVFTIPSDIRWITTRRQVSDAELSFLFSNRFRMVIHPVSSEFPFPTIFYLAGRRDRA